MVNKKFLVEINRGFEIYLIVPEINDGYKPVFTPMYKIPSKPPFAMICP